MTRLAPAVEILLVILVVVAAVYDIRFRRIPNWLCAAGLVAGFGLNGFLYGGAGLRSAGLGFLLAFVVYFFFYILHAMGAGDAKFMSAVGCFVGPSNWFGLFLFTAILGGVTACIMLFSRGRFRQTLWNVGYIVGEMARFRAPYMNREELDVNNPKVVTLPHGVTIALGTAAFIISSRYWG